MSGSGAQSWNRTGEHRVGYGPDHAWTSRGPDLHRARRAERCDSEAGLVALAPPRNCFTAAGQLGKEQIASQQARNDAGTAIAMNEDLVGRVLSMA